MRWWKVVGLAGVAGVVASGVAVARDERKRTAYTPEQIRARLQARIPSAAPSHSDTDSSTGSNTATNDAGKAAHNDTASEAG